jgi:putative ABC transport system permease protein
MGMLRNYFKVAWRNLVKNRGYTLLNITGLAIGLTSFLLIALYVIDELSYDQFHEKGDRIYRINSDIRFGGSDLHLAVTSDPMGATLKRDYPQVEQFCRIYASSGSKLIRKGNEFVNEQKVAHADSTFFDMFTFPAIMGDIRHALDEPNTVVVTEAGAKKYFGSVDKAMGAMVETNDKGKSLYKVTAVIRDMPEHAHFRYDFLFSMKNVDYDWGTYLSHNFQTYILLKPGADPKDFDRIFQEVLIKYVLPEAKTMVKLDSWEDFKKAGNKMEYSLMPMTKIHLYSDRFPELAQNGDIRYVWIFSAVAFFILLIACINFMNLSTARSAGRAREVGIRKVLGSEKSALIGQFLTETTLMVVFSLVLAILLAWLLMPWFNQLAGKQLGIGGLLGWKVLPFLILLPFVVGGLAGSYPAFYLSSFQPIKVLKGKLSAGVKRSNLRSGLVVVQFMTSIFLITATIVVYQQLNYIQSKKLGFNKDQVLILDGTHALGSNSRAFLEEVRKMPGVVSGTEAAYWPVENSSRSDNTYFTSPVMDARNGLDMQSWRVDDQYVPTMGMEIIKGRNFSREFGTDSLAMIINEEAAKAMGMADPVGKFLYTGDYPDQTKILKYTIIGVVKDFQFENMHKSVGPLNFRYKPEDYGMGFRVSTKDVHGLVGKVESRFKAMAPGMPFMYRFLDDSFDEMYRTEQRMGRLALTFSLLAILIACLGLFGLAAYMAEQRTKEIGIRKVLGAGTLTVVNLLSADFLRLVAIASIIAIPFAWWAMHRWLQDFAFRIDLSWWIFPLAAILALAIALATVSFQAIRAALMNPVKSLRTE